MAITERQIVAELVSLYAGPVPANLYYLGKPIRSSVPNTQFLIPTNSVQCPGVSAHEPRRYVQNRRKRVERGLQWLGLTILPLIASFSYSSSADPLASAGQTAAAAVLPY
jgi:hypothetical protein